MKRLVLLSICFFSSFALFAADFSSAEDTFVESLPSLGEANELQSFKYSKKTNGRLVIYTLEYDNENEEGVLAHYFEIYTFEYGLRVCREIRYDNAYDINALYRKYVQMVGRPDQRKGNNQIWFTFSGNVQIINIEGKTQSLMASDFFFDTYYD